MTAEKSAKQPAVVRIWRGRTRRERGDEYEAYNYEVGVKPLIEKAMGVQTLREDRGDETEFVTISYWESVVARFTGKDPTAIHHLPRDPEFLIEMPKSVQVLKLCHFYGNIGGPQLSQPNKGTLKCLRFAGPTPRASSCVAISRNRVDFKAFDKVSVAPIILRIGLTGHLGVQLWP